MHTVSLYPINSRIRSLKTAAAVTFSGNEISRVCPLDFSLPKEPRARLREERETKFSSLVLLRCIALMERGDIRQRWRGHLGRGAHLSLVTSHPSFLLLMKDSRLHHRSPYHVSPARAVVLGRRRGSWEPSILCRRERDSCT